MCAAPGIDEQDPADGRDTAAQHRDDAADVRDLVADERDDAGDLRDDAADLRDLASGARDVAAARRDAAADRRDELALQRERASREPAHEAHAARHEAAQDRRWASRDRGAGADARVEAEQDRSTAHADRGSGATERGQAEDDRGTALADRGASARDREDASLDSLTGAYVRGPGLLQLEREVLRARRTDQPLTVGFVDVDGLKAVNDAGGHAAGDRLLARVSAVLRERLRPYDLVVRYGGDEFLCVLSGLSTADAERRFELVNQDLAGHGSVTVGVVTAATDELASAVVERADAALYRRRHVQREVQPGLDRPTEP
jgi:diguanylate cyclase (GGDEF)-like protein